MEDHTLIPKPPKTGCRRVAVAMSGGVDSSVVAAMLHDVGWEVMGLTMRLYHSGDANTPFHHATTKSCCAGRDIADAQHVAHRLNIPHYVLDYEQQFQKDVIDDFADSYINGQTPLPCVRCNQKIKFHHLLQQARELGCRCLATGHYVRQEIRKTEPNHLYRAIDKERDQSYFLFATTRQQLPFLLFPLGNFRKKDVRCLAQHYQLGDISDKKDSQDLCFVPHGHYSNLVQRLRPDAMTPGPIIDTHGNVVGSHRGLLFYTVGQRKGLPLKARHAHTAPHYVIAIDNTRNTITVGTQKDLSHEAVQLTHVNWLGEEDIDTDMTLDVRLRSTATPVKARVRLTRAQGHEKQHAGGASSPIPLSATVCFHHPTTRTARGQACAFYHQERLLGGGWVC
ncbi:MAG: tRNA 2-thiouridine(34) synthase MnmA [Alphaproteobacteria bacterium GM7ARS4]|nr:tRNA 2-thiouridine(34) synthase MnmA [Alphaproteobacteria bacterium GM7ARS4]